jgi:tetratricopeptide (TPR) repeat protein
MTWQHSPSLKIMFQSKHAVGNIRVHICTLRSDMSCPFPHVQCTEACQTPLLLSNFTSAQCLEQANKSSLRDAHLLEELAVAHVKKGLFHEAIPILKKAVACVRDNPPYNLLAAFGESLSACNDLPAARQQWKAARAVAKNSQERAVADASMETIDESLGEAFRQRPVAPAISVAN